MTGALDARGFKAAARTFPSGVTVVATRHRERVLAKTVSAFTTLSLDPPLISAAVGNDSPLIGLARDSGALGVSVLRDDQRGVAEYYATSAALRAGPPPSPLLSATGSAPVLADCLSWFDCRLVAALPGGDHTILVGRAVAVQVHGGLPLVHHDSGYRTVTAEPRPTWESRAS
ncbi:flavin reductase [Sphaerisporangium siamense]|uniref:Flavin reductase (DIM6/NTAB) family NADH-FMN oxidoreductase RutF n=1 Tax=Sphaerisporangium siamense TaxID=795645 RepID=A0A7W7G965_9ACTN|nr:flavin reductase family protein [Sphaerisporangium siamense]MBB4700972.1 flavin reductase (DIM6/NTAB) family NADH-FMN oxidoreductase RutF [Sphaerisporangium siamense]GII85882.1 flavin reductase [Sphaerisporangium siamense]